MIFISVTRLRVRSPRFLFGFFWYVARSAFQAKRSSGNRKLRLRRTSGLTFWTLTLWENAESMTAYRGASPHRDAMPKLQHWCDEASVVHWEQESPVLPSWNYAAERLRTLGRLSKVLNPSEAQRAGIIATT